MRLPRELQMYRTRRTRLVWGSGARKRRFLNFRTSLSAWWNRYYEDGGDGLEAARHVYRSATELQVSGGAIRGFSAASVWM